MREREREKHPHFGSETSHGKFHPERIIFHKYASNKWQCDHNTVCPWIPQMISCCSSKLQAHMLGAKEKHGIGSVIRHFYWD